MTLFARFLEKKSRFFLFLFIATIIVLALLVPAPTRTDVVFSQTEPTHQQEIDAVESACANQSYVLPEGTAGQNTETTFALEEAVFVAPPNAAGATSVDIGLFVIEITEIDEKSNTFQLEAYLDLVWCDPRLAFDAETAGVDRQIFLEEDAALKTSRIWWPDITIANESGARTIENEIITIYPDGTVDYEERFSAKLEARYDLRQFPFDSQQLEIEIESFAWSSEYLIFHEESDKVGFSAEFQIPEWRTENVTAEIIEKQEIRDRTPFSEFILFVDVVRESSFYMWKIFIPLVLLVAMSWSVFWMIGDGLADRMSVSLTGILTVVAYQFIITESLPRVNYFTWMDSVLSLSFSMMAFTIVENVYVNVLYLQDKNSTANRVDHICRWLFPTTYFGIIIILSLIDFL